jgi:hypothetical protein
MCNPVLVAMAAMQGLSVASEQMAANAQAGAIEKSLDINTENKAAVASQRMNNRRRQNRRDRAAQLNAQFHTGIRADTGSAVHQQQQIQFRSSEEVSTIDSNFKRGLEADVAQARAQVAGLGVSPLQAAARIGGTVLSGMAAQGITGAASTNALDGVGEIADIGSIRDLPNSGVRLG